MNLIGIVLLVLSTAAIFALGSVKATTTVSRECTSWETPYPGCSEHFVGTSRSVFLLAWIMVGLLTAASLTAASLGLLLRRDDLAAAGAIGYVALVAIATVAPLIGENWLSETFEGGWWLVPLVIFLVTRGLSGAVNRVELWIVDLMLGAVAFLGAGLILFTLLWGDIGLGRVGSLLAVCGGFFLALGLIGALRLWLGKVAKEETE